jgi:tRNA threonylcarbamoyladenosine biosynthesis protein TsaB
MLSSPAPQRAPNVLALDTATDQLAVALQAGEHAYAVLAEGGAQASAVLLPQVQALLSRSGLRLADLDCIAFGRGPGAFTGLRTACSVAQGLAFGIGKPVLPIDSLLIVAEDARVQHAALAAAAPERQQTPATDGLTVGVAMDARMDEIYAGVYHWAAGRWTTVQAPALQAPGPLGQAWSTVALDVLAGSALSVFAERLCWPPRALRLPLERHRAQALLRLALRSAAAGEGLDPALALPLYLRDKVAQTVAERAAARAAAAHTG